MRMGRSLIVAVLVIGSLTAATISKGQGLASEAGSGAAGGGYNTTLAQDAGALQQTLAWIANPAKAKKKYRVAWVKEDAGLESYTQKETQGGLDAAKAYGGTVKVYDAKFNPNQQYRDLQDAITAYKAGQFDAIVVTPVAGSVVCNQVKKAIAQGIPVEIVNLSVCGDKGYHPGAIGYVGMQQQRSIDEDYATTFSSCKTKCNMLVITGPIGFDLTTKDLIGAKKAAKKYPNVHVVETQSGPFTPTAWYQIARQALTAHPEINVISTNWDDSAIGVIRAVKQARKKPGKDIQIFSVGGNGLGVKLIKSGDLAETGIVTPYHDGLYGMHQVFRFLISGKKTVGSVYPGDAPFIKGTVGRRLLTKANINKWKPEY